MIEPFKDPLQLAKLSTTATDAELGDRFGVSTRTICWWRARFGIPPAPYAIQLPRFRKKRLNTRFFETIDTEAKAYFLGFLAADGYVNRNGKSLGCAVALRDAHILEDMRAALGSGADVIDKTCRDSDWKRTPQKAIDFCSREMVADLAKHGIGPAKSVTIAFPSLPVDMERHFIRGVWDGDGYIGPRQFSLIGSAAMMSGVADTVERHTGRRLTSSPITSGQPRIVGNRSDEDVLHWLYAEASFYLRRKHQSYMAHWW